MQLLEACDFARENPPYWTLLWHFQNTIRFPATSANKLWQLPWSQGTDAGSDQGKQQEAGMRCSSFLGCLSICWQQRSAKFAIFPFQVPKWASSPCLSLWSPALFTPQIPHSVQPHIWGQSSAHLYFWLSKYFRYFPSNSVHYSLLSNPTSSLCSAQRSPWLLFQPLSPHCGACKLLSWPSSSQGSGPHLPSFRLFSSSWPQNPHFATSHNGGSFSIPPLSFLSTAMICSSKLLVSLAPHLLSVFPLLWSSFSHCLHLSTHQLPAGQNSPIYLVLQDTPEKNIHGTL